MDIVERLKASPILRDSVARNYDEASAEIIRLRAELAAARDAALEEAASVADDEANANAAMDLHSREEAAASIAGNIRTLKATP